MTLAIYGKSRQRQQILVLAAFLAIILGALAGASLWKSNGASAAPQVVFFEDFTDPDLAGWERFGTTQQLNGVAEIIGNGSSIRRNVSTAGYHSIRLDLLCRGNGFNEDTEPDPDHLAIDYSATGIDGPWTIIETFTTGNTSSGCEQDEWSEHHLDLAGIGAAEDNPSFAIRLRSINHDGDAERARIEWVRISGQSTAPTITVSKADGVLENGQVRWNVWFTNSGPAVTVRLADLYTPNGTGTVLAGSNGPVSGCSYTPTFWTDCLANLNGASVNNGRTLITFYTTPPPDSCTPSAPVYNQVEASIDVILIPPTPGMDTQGVYIHPATPCDGLSIDKLDSTRLIDDGGSIEWTIELHNAGVEADLASVRDVGATLISSSCIGGNTATQAGDIIKCMVPPGAAGGPPEATLKVKTLYNPSSLEECKGGTRTNYAELIAAADMAAPLVTDGLSDTATATLAPWSAAPHCISVEKTLVSEGTWHIAFTNTGAEAQVNFSDTYESPNGGQITSIAVNGTQVPGCSYDAYSSRAWDCRLTLPPGIQASSETTVVVTTDQVSGTCNGILVKNTVEAFFGDTPVDELSGSPSTAEYTETADCQRFVKLCKAWTLDAPGEVSDGQANFDFHVRDQDAGKGEPSALVTIPNVVEGGGPECVVLQVKAGLVSIDEVGPAAGFVYDGWTGAIGPDPDLGPIDDTRRPLYILVEDSCTEPQPAFAGGALALVAHIQQVVMVVDADSNPIRCTITYFNHDTHDRVPTGGLRIEKYRDINGDGDGNDLALGEGLIGWDIEIDGPDPAVYGSHFITDGTLAFDDLVPGDTYTVTEQTVSGWRVANTTVDGVSVGATHIATTTVPNAGQTVIRYFNQPLGSLTVHKIAETSHDGLVQPAPNDDDGWVITVSSAACGFASSLTTDANGHATFTNLPKCLDYIVSESADNPSSPGFVPIGAASVSNQAANGQTLTFVNRRTSTTSPPPASPPAPEATPVVATTTPPPQGPAPSAPSTPVVPTATPSVGASPTPVSEPPAPISEAPRTAIAGASAPPIQPTPVAPETGSGSGGEQRPGSGAARMLIGSLAALAGILGMLAHRRRA